MARHLDRDEIAVFRAGGMIAGDSELATELLFVDRYEAAAAARQAAKDSEHAVLGAVDQLDDAPARFLVAGSLDAQQRAVADACDFSRPRAAGCDDADDRRSAVSVFVPFRGARQQLAVAVAAGDVGKHDLGQRAGAMQPLAMPLDAAAIRQLAQHALEFRPIGILRAKCARDFARADLAGVLADKGKKLLARGQGSACHRALIGRVRGQ